MKIGIVLAHPDFEESRANRAMWDAIQNIPDLVLKDLYSEYPSFYIDVDAEQNFLKSIDVLILQHPIFWYHMPALLKHWVDEVFAYQWAYGPGGEQLKGKYWLQAITLGGPEEVYQRAGHNKFTVHEFLRPHEQTAYLCQMRPLLPFCLHGSSRVDEQQIKIHANQYREMILDIQNGRMPPVYSSF
jgi:glutathione-regulated potassium-efflux system ancillary protein KefG